MCPTMSDTTTALRTQAQPVVVSLVVKAEAGGENVVEGSGGESAEEGSGRGNVEEGGAGGLKVRKVKVNRVQMHPEQTLRPKTWTLMM